MEVLNNSKEKILKEKNILEQNWQKQYFGSVNSINEQIEESQKTMKGNAKLTFSKVNAGLNSMGFVEKQTDRLYDKFVKEKTKDNKERPVNEPHIGE